MSQIPKNWTRSKVGNIATLHRGVNYQKNQAEGSPNKNNCLVLRGGNIQDGKILIGNDVVFVPIELISEDQFLKKEDVIIVGSTGSKELIGKAAISTKDEHKVAFGAFLMLLRPLKEVNGKYFGYFFLTNEYRNAIRELSGGININNIRREHITSIPFPLPPLPEQKRIVAKLDSLFAYLDQLKARLENIPTLIKQFRQAVLTQAVTGKMTEEWRHRNELPNWMELVQEKIRIREKEYALAVSNSKIKNIEKPSSPEYLDFSIKDLERHAISSWVIAPVGLVCNSIVPGRDKPKSFTGHIPWITTPDITTDYIALQNAKMYLSEAEVEEVRAKLIPIESVVVSIVGRFGISCIIKDKCVINQQLHAFLPSELIIPEYLMYYFRTLEGHMNTIASATTIAYINKSKINGIRINLPPLQEQKQIVLRVKSLFAFADLIEDGYKTLQEKIDHLPQAILAKAFRGELVENETRSVPREVLNESM